ncbi:MAG TPA: hypothetical protein VGA19_09505, partial [Rhodospirillales bacterium]
MARAALALAFFGLCLVVLHLFFTHIGSAPYLATDDAVANIAHSLAWPGRYGFPSSPIQGGTYALRTDNFFNYGPWYFYVGAALSWLFGTSIEVQRAIHPLGMMAIAAMAMVTFRRLSVAAGGLAAAALLYLFVYVHWPMVRPDIMVAALAMAGIASATTAIVTDRPRWWLAAAFFTMAAVTQHQIAGAIAPALLVVWAIAAWARPYYGDEAAGPGRRIWLPGFLAAAAGVFAAGLVYLLAIDFRLAELIDHLRSYATTVADAGDRGGYWAVLGKHYQSAWLGMSYWPYAGFGLALVGLGAVRFLRPGERRTVVAYLLPPVVISAAYQLSLGFYGNWHSGYAILTQVSVVWAGAAGVGVVVYLLGQRAAAVRGFLDPALILAVALLFVAEARLFLERPSGWQLSARQWVNIGDYVDRVLGPLPPRARAWGTVQFGLETGIRTDLLQFYEGIKLAEFAGEMTRITLAPDFLVYGPYQLNFETLEIMRGGTKTEFFEKIARLFPGFRFDVMHLVTAPPYGAARVYRRVGAGEAAGSAPPSVAVNDGRSRQWSSRLLAAAPVSFRPSGPVTIRLPLSADRMETFVGKTAQVAELAPGAYLIDAEITRRGQGAGVLVATRTDRFTGQFSETGYGFVPAPYFPDEAPVRLLLAHPGGPLYISQFDADPAAGFRVLSVRPVETIQPATTAVPLPPLDRWRPGGKDARVVAAGAAFAEVEGDASPWGYQLVSPPVAVEPGATLTLAVPLDVAAGKVA